MSPQLSQDLEQLEKEAKITGISINALILIKINLGNYPVLNR